MVFSFLDDVQASVELNWMGIETPSSGATPLTAERAGGDVRVDQTVGFRVVLWIAVAAIGALGWTVVCTVPAIHWNSARLAPSFALATGHTIYALRDSAEQLGWIYGPVFPLWYLPATLFDNPTIALAVAGIQNAITIIAPVVWLVWLAGVGRRAAVLVGVFCAALMLGSPILRLAFFYVHVDAVCLAAGWVACGALWRATQNSRRWLHVAAIALVLAIWTKQLAVMLLPGMLIWLWRERQLRLAWPLVFWSGCYGALTTLIVFAWFGTEPVIFNLVYFHTRHPSRGGVEMMAGLVASLLASIWMWVPAATCVAMRGWPKPARCWVAPAAGSLVRLLLWTALTQLPLGLTALLQQGGGVNSLHAFNYVLVAGFILLGHAIASALDSKESSWWLGWSVALLLPLATGFHATIRTHARWEIYRGLEGMVAMAREKPRTYYFPWNPLVTLIAERRVYPFDDALYCLWLRKLDPPIDTVRAALPPKPIIIYDEPAQSKFALRYFPDLKPTQ